MKPACTIPGSACRPGSGPATCQVHDVPPYGPRPGSGVHQYGYASAPRWPERAVRGYPEEVVTEGEQAAFPERCRPRAHRVCQGRFGGACACPAFLGEHDQPGTGVDRVAAPLDVALGDEPVDELRPGLPGDVEVLGQLGDGGASGSKPGESEAMRGAQVVESAGLYPG